MNELVTECFAYVWAMEPGHLRRLIAQLAAIPQAALDVAIKKRVESGTAQAFDNHQGNSKAEKPPHAEVRDGVAHIHIAGPILKTVPSVFEMFGIKATSTEAVREMLTAAVEDPKVKSIVLDVDSPGGTVDGVAELAGDVRAARDLKPVHTHAPDLMTSASYWIGCQAGSVSCGPTAAVGSIGVYSVIEDTSAIAEKRGVKVHVIASHPLKGAGVDGSKITDAQLEDAQRVINSYAALFIAAVAEGRGISAKQAADASTGQVWIGAECIDLALVDAVQSADDAHAGSIQGSAAQPRTAPRISTAAAIVAASQESQMTNVEADRLAAENAKLKAQLAATEANALALLAEQKMAVLTKYADRFMPAAAVAFEKMAEHMSLDDLERHMGALPKVVRDIASPAAMSVPARTAINGIASLTGYDPFTRDPVGGQAGAEQVARLLGTSVGAIDRFADVECGYSNGTFKMLDGRVLTVAELKKLKAA